MDELGDLVEYVLPHHPMRSGIHAELASRRVLLAQQTRDGMVPFWTRSSLSHFSVFTSDDCFTPQTACDMQNSQS
jgi:hypothetical protein